MLIGNLLSTLLVLLFDAGAAARYSLLKGNHRGAGQQARIEKAHSDDDGPMANKSSALVAMSGAPLHRTTLRPNAGGEPDVVTFGIFVKDFYGMDLKSSTWNGDLVLTLMWHDDRNMHLVPPGSDEVTLDVETANKVMWLPDMMVSNRARGGIESISTAFSVRNDGTVLKVERVSAELQSAFQLAAFPFDKQTLRATLASSKYMVEDLVLQPTNDTNIFGINSETFDGKDISLKSYELNERKDHSGSLSKSRGEILVHVSRDPEPYLIGILWPQFVMVMISWTVFWLPLQPPFAMPRVATALIAFLTLMTLSLRTSAMLPVRGDTSWLDLVESNCSGLLLYNVIFNTCCLVLAHVVGEMELATGVNKELVFVYAGMAVILASICIFAAFQEGEHLGTFAMVCNILLALMGLAFVASCLIRFFKLRQERKEAAAEAAESGHLVHAKSTVGA
eukprot:gnl/TRDRNA2_/TRDRNA2_59573_c0_seq1.p1 gnl/TRDRNA2_/TRDRNA2_59573_c0~~gnl/TRDRNA2_/TRDRNA2_59573_c0_seq1.p1  ORF type:complete len:450 (+),score=80.16 gnl/TRDRNA2_/TRDRNA2_59573_c0_seq1:33-1382(+)